MLYKFDEILVDDTKSCKKIKKQDYLTTGKYPIIDQGQTKVSGYWNDANDLYEDVPAIIFGDHTRIVKYVDKPFFIGADGVKVIICKNKDINYKYLFYLLKSIHIPNTGYSRHFKWIKNYQFDIHDIKDQKRIVDTLDSISNIINLRKKQLEIIDLLVKAKFNEMFGDPVLNTLKFPVGNLSDIALYRNGLTYRPEDVAEKGLLVLRSSNIQNDIIVFDDNVYVNCRVDNDLMVNNNDILMCSRNGSAKLVGKVGLINKGNNFSATFGAFMMIIRSDYYPYLLWYFRTEAFRQQIKNGATTTINQITRRMLDKIKLPIPEKDIVDKFKIFIDKVEENKTSIQSVINQLETLRDSLMQKYFMEQ